MIMDCSRLERAIGYQFKDKRLLTTALTHRSVKGVHNERFEFLGDSILNFVIGHALFEQMPHAKEGDLSRYRAMLVCEDTLADLAHEFQLSDFLILGVGELKSGGFRRKSILADAVEAIIAAIYLDADIMTAQRCVTAWYAKRLTDITAMKVKKDPKSTLQEILQAKKMALPLYSIIEILGEAHEQTFKVCCAVEGFIETTEGVGSSRRAAEQDAAQTFIKEVLRLEL